MLKSETDPFPRVSEFPWHATLYKQSSRSKEFICSATIIQASLLVTAAHCVYDEATKLAQAEEYFVAAGNVFQDYDSSFHNVSIVKKRRVGARIDDFLPE